MAVTVWKGQLTFGLVSIPVRLVRAARHETVGFHQLYRAEPPAPSLAAPGDREETDDSDDRTEAAPPPVTRVQQSVFVPEAPSQAPIPRENIVKGFEYEKGRYVVIE
jgi:non-homologous end joining protein Ku